MANEIIAVMGATGTQGSGVVKELLARGQFGVRVLTRNRRCCIIVVNSLNLLHFPIFVGIRKLLISCVFLGIMQQRRSKVVVVERG